MKIAGKIIFLLGVCCFLMTYSGCKKDNPKPPPITDQQLDLLSKTSWHVTAVTLGTASQMADYSTFQMTFSGTKGSTTVNYTSSGRTAPKYPWGQTGTLTFDVDNPATTMLRDDGVTVTYTATTDQLNMSFNYTGNGFNPRVNVVKGQWSFTLEH